MNHLKDLTLVVVAKDQENMDGFDQSYVAPAELVLVINYEQASLASIGNYWLDRSRRLFGMCHADVYFGPGALEVFAQTANDGMVAGVVGYNPDLVKGGPGANPGNGPAGQVWAYQNPGPVSTLDSAAIFFSKDSGLRFDQQTFDSFHLQNEDLCLQASQNLKMPVVVPAADATHRSCERNGREWQNAYWPYYHKFEDKWRGVRFGVT